MKRVFSNVYIGKLLLSVGVLVALLQGCGTPLPSATGTPSPARSGSAPSAAPQTTSEAPASNPATKLPPSVSLPPEVTREYAVEGVVEQEWRTLVTDSTNGYAFYLPQDFTYVSMQNGGMILHKGDTVEGKFEADEAGGVLNAQAVIRIDHRSDAPQAAAEKLRDQLVADRFTVEELSEVSRPDAPVDGWSVYAESEDRSQLRFAFLIPDGAKGSYALIKIIRADVVEQYNARFDSWLRDFAPMPPQTSP